MAESMKRRISRAVRGSRAYTSSVWLVDRALDRVIGRTSGNGRQHLLLAATGNGNIGDQAMFEAYLENVHGPITVICENTNYLYVPAPDQQRVRMVALPRFMRGTPLLRGPEVRAYLRLLNSAASVSVTGADLMDGLYNTASSVARASALKSAEHRGIPARVLGFSWSPDAHPRARAAMRRLTSTRVLARDPRSYERLIADGISNVTQVADTVFASTTVNPNTPADEWISRNEASGTPIAIVNCSALIGNRINQIPDYVAITRSLVEQGYAILLLPHVLRTSDDDLSESRNLRDALSDVSAFLIESPLSPAQVRGLTSRAQIVVTGRMHLAIMTLMQERIPVTLSTQGKVEGLYELFGLDPLAVDPVPGLASAVIDHIGRTRDAALIEVARRELPQVVDLARRNFSEL
jgi:colanic acid/amylovoran biosynthesis protein